MQRDLLPLIEGTTVSTKHGPVQTDHVLFIASGAFHIAKPSDLLPELQGRLPIRVELRALTEADFVRILTETDNALTRQYSALMATENVGVDFTEDGIAALARIAAEVNRAVENIGARRLHTVLERVFEDLSFTAPDRRRRPGDGRRGLRRDPSRRAQPLGRPQPLRALRRSVQASAGRSARDGGDSSAGPGALAGQGDGQRDQREAAGAAVEREPGEQAPAGRHRETAGGHAGDDGRRTGSTTSRGFTMSSSLPAIWRGGDVNKP